MLRPGSSTFSTLTYSTPAFIMDNHRISILHSEAQEDKCYGGLTEKDTYPFGIYHHNSSLLVSYTKKDNFPRLDVRLIYISDDKAFRTRCGFSVRLSDVPDLVEVLLAMLKVSDVNIRYPVPYFQKHPIAEQIPPGAIQHLLCKKRTKPPTKEPSAKRPALNHLSKLDSLDKSEQPSASAGRVKNKVVAKNDVKPLSGYNSDTDIISDTDNEGENE